MCTASNIKTRETYYGEAWAYPKSKTSATNKSIKAAIRQSINRCFNNIYNNYFGLKASAANTKIMIKPGPELKEYIPKKKMKILVEKNIPIF